MEEWNLQPRKSNALKPLGYKMTEVNPIIYILPMSKYHSRISFSFPSNCSNNFEDFLKFLFPWSIILAGGQSESSVKGAVEVYCHLQLQIVRRWRARDREDDFLLNPFGGRNFGDGDASSVEVSYF